MTELLNMPGSGLVVLIVLSLIVYLGDQNDSIPRGRRNSRGGAGGSCGPGSGN